MNCIICGYSLNGYLLCATCGAKHRWKHGVRSVVDAPEGLRDLVREELPGPFIIEKPPRVENWVGTDGHPTTAKIPTQYVASHTKMTYCPEDACYFASMSSASAFIRSSDLGLSDAVIVRKFQKETTDD